jgi:hypothetical protein
MLARVGRVSVPDRDHALALPGCVDAVADAFGHRPLLAACQVAWLGVEPRMAAPPLMASHLP